MAKPPLAQLDDHLRIALQAEETCALCGTRAFEGPRQARTVREWLRESRPELYGRLLQRFRVAGAGDIAAVPDDWPSRIDDAFSGEIAHELDLSAIGGDHLIPLRLLELLVPDGEITAEMIAFAARHLGIPVCERCRRVRNLRGLPDPAELMERWVTFRGGVAAVQADPLRDDVELLVTAAYRIDRGLRRISGRIA